MRTKHAPKPSPQLGDVVRERRVDVPYSEYRYYRVVRERRNDVPYSEYREVLRPIAPPEEA